MRYYIRKFYTIDGKQVYRGKAYEIALPQPASTSSTPPIQPIKNTIFTKYEILNLEINLLFRIFAHDKTLLPQVLSLIIVYIICIL